MEGFWSLLRSWLRPHWGLSQEQLSLYLRFFEVVHNVRQRGLAFLHAFVALLVTAAPGLHHARQLGRDDRVFQYHAVRDFYLYTAHLYSMLVGRRRATRVVMAPSSQGAVIAIITFRREGTPQQYLRGARGYRAPPHWVLCYTWACGGNGRAVTPVEVGVRTLGHRTVRPA